ncbi:MAG TPA: putative baseplate assembly protein [Longimicrobium sp.]|nr:putative baseplate assembly protein [Longimicrobium sp.]
MSTARDETLRGLDSCGCCTGTDAATPLAVANRAGLTAVAYRVGTHGTFLETLLASLSAPGGGASAAPGGGLPPLQALTAREGDFTPALLDAWAVVGDVLTFYSERIANEAYLRTATERRSVLELARSIGYELNPGVAAATHLAFTLEEVPGAPERVTIAPYTRAQSIPGPGERPQSFETVDPLEARPAWNALRPRMSRPYEVKNGATQLWLAGIPAPVQPGDLLLVQVAGTNNPVSVTAVEADTAAGRSLVTLNTTLTGSVAPTRNWQASVYRQRAAVFGHNAADWKVLPNDMRARMLNRQPTKTDPVVVYAPVTETEWPAMPLSAQAKTLDLDAVYPGIAVGSRVVISAPGKTTLVRVVQSTSVVEPALFGIAGKVTQLSIAETDLSGYPRRQTTVFILPEPLVAAEQPITEPIPAPFPGPPQGTAPAYQQPGLRRFPLARATERMEKGRTVIVRGKPVRAKVGPTLTHGGGGEIQLHGPDGARGTSAQMNEVFSLRRLWLLPPPAGVGMYPRVRVLLRDPWGAEWTAETPVPQLLPLPAAPDDEEVAEVAVVEKWDDSDPEHPVIEFAADLRHVYDRATAVVLGNVAYATHGESVAERLGSGDGAQAFQRFALKQKPLTYTPDDSPDGGASTLEVRVGELKWTEVPSLYGRTPRDRVYVTRRQDDGTTVVQFGDGREGARLPTGRENVQAGYRKGIGREGNVRARQLAQLITRELGVRDVINPLPASGGMDPQERDDARENAPVTVLTMERVVSLRDYEDFARAFAGVAHAQGVWTWDAGVRGVFLTVAGPRGDEVPDGGPVHGGLRAALGKAGDPHVPVRVASYRPRRFRLKAVLRRDADRLSAAVLRDAEAALRARFGFAGREFGRPVWRNDVIATLQNVAGVAAVDVDLLYRQGDTPGTQPELSAYAPPAGALAGGLQGAELLLIDLRPGDLEVKE